MFLVAIMAVFVGRSILIKRSNNQDILNKKTNIVSSEETISRKNSMIIYSSAFENQGSIPVKYTCDGENISPPLKISGVPAEAKSLVLIVDDPDSPAGNWIHWTIWNINPETAAIEEGLVPTGAAEGLTSFGDIGYGGPCPSGGEHRYFFKLFALDNVLEVKPGANDQELMQMMNGHIMTTVELIGYYKRVFSR